jgi:hypothetical protein
VCQWRQTQKITNLRSTPSAFPYNFLPIEPQKIWIYYEKGEIWAENKHLDYVVSLNLRTQPARWKLSQYSSCLLNVAIKIERQTTRKTNLNTFCVAFWRRNIPLEVKVPFEEKIRLQAKTTQRRVQRTLNNQISRWKFFEKFLIEDFAKAKEPLNTSRPSRNLKNSKTKLKVEK